MGLAEAKKILADSEKHSRRLVEQAQEIVEKTKLTESELEAIDFVKETQAFSIVKATELTTTIEFSESQAKVLKDQVKKVGDEKNITLETVQLAKKLEKLSV